MEPAKAYETSVDIDIDAYLPVSYIANEAQKLDLYKRIAGIENTQEKEEMQEELTDRFGDLPKAVENLLTLAEYKAKAHKHYITEITQKGDEIRFVLFERADLDPVKIPQFVSLYQGKVKFYADKRMPYFIYRLKMNSKQKENAMDAVADVLEKMKLLCGDLGDRKEDPRER